MTIFLIKKLNKNTKKMVQTISAIFPIKKIFTYYLN